MSIDEILDEMMKDKKLSIEIKNRLGILIRKISEKNFKMIPSYSKYLNLKDFMFCYENSEKKGWDKEYLITSFLESKFAKIEEKDYLLKDLKKFDISDKMIDRIFKGQELQVDLKIKHFDKYFEYNSSNLHYLWNEKELTTDLMDKFIPIENKKEQFLVAFKNEMVNVPKELLTLEGLIYCSELKNKKEEQLTDVEKDIINLRDFDYLMESYLSSLNEEETKKILSLTYEQQVKLFETENKLLLFHNVNNNYKKIKYRKEEINEDLPLKVLLSVKKYPKSELNKMVKSELNEYFENNKEEKQYKVKNGTIIKQILVNQDFQDELLLNYGTKIEPSTLILYNDNKKDMSKETIKKILKKYSNDKDLIDSFIYYDFPNMTEEVLKELHKECIFGEKTSYPIFNFMKVKDEKFLGELKIEGNEREIFTNQVLSENFLKDKSKHYEDTEKRAFFSVLYNQKNLPKEFIDKVKKMNREMSLICNVNYMYDKNLEGYEDKVINYVSTFGNGVSGGEKFDVLLSYIMNQLLQENKLRVERTNVRYIDLLKEEDYNKKFNSSNKVLKSTNDLSLN